MTAHPEDRVHWRKVQALLEEREEKGMAVLDLADKMGLDRAPIDPELLRAVDQLVAQGRAALVLGMDKSGMPCRWVRLAVERAGSRRERLDDPHRGRTRFT